MAGAFIRLARCEAYADCDVDAPNLHLLVQSETTPETDDFFGMAKYEIDPDLCRGCGRCEAVCGFEAIHPVKNRFEIVRERCEGCSTCALVCPAGAISQSPEPNGKLMLFRSPAIFSTARLQPGSGNSGLLVTSVKNRLRDASRTDFEIWDGSPGIGCPVIASMSGADLILAVTEPSLSGLSDLERMLQTASKFQIPVVVCVNKATANPEMTERIDAFCQQNEIPMVGHIPYDPQVVRLTNAGLSIVDEEGPSGSAAREIFPRVMAFLKSKENG